MNVASLVYAMKNKGLAAVAIITLFAVARPILGEITVETDAGPLYQPSDPVAELRNHDDAFALLIECFRQLQAGLIEADYENRLTAANKLPDAAKQEEVRSLSRQERDLRVEKLNTQLSHMLSAYTYARASDEREAGVEVPMQVNTTTAAQKLQNFVAIVPEVRTTKANEEIVVTRIVPASLFLRPQRSAEVQQIAAH